MNRKFFFWPGVFVLMASLFSCTKRIDEPIAVRPGNYNNSVGSSSSLRLVNLCYGGNPDYSKWNTPPGKLDVSINGRRLTTFLNYYGETETSVSPTPWFPKGFLNFGDLFTPPDSLLDAQGNGTVQFYSTGEYVPAGRTPFADTPLLRATVSLHNDPQNPQDVLIYDSGIVRTLVLPRTAVSAPQPDHFRIRLVNLDDRHVTGSYSLLYANGAPVDPKTSNIPYHTAGAYVDLPYATYQFKLTDQHGMPLNQNGSVAVDLATGELAGSNYPDYTPAALTYNPLRTFKPGGIYTVVVHPTLLYNADLNNQIQDTLAAYTILPDNAPAATNYIQVMGVNALSGQRSVHFAVDGLPLGGNLDFGQYSPYGHFGAGAHTIQAIDATNRVIVSTSINTYAFDNWTVWAYNQGGQAKIMVTGNDMSMSYSADVGFYAYAPVPVNQPGYGLLCRFLNLSEDVPQASFYDPTGNFGPADPVGNDYDTVSLVDVVNKTGVVVLDLGTAASPVTANARNIARGQTITAWSVTSGQQGPGLPLSGSLDHPFLANKDFYRYGTGYIPNSEPGVYSVALIGATTGTTDGDKLKLIVIKHNQ